MNDIFSLAYLALILATYAMVANNSQVLVTSKTKSLFPPYIMWVLG